MILKAVMLLAGVAMLALPPPASAEEKLRIVVNTPLSGPAANRGVGEREGAELAVAEINAAGGVQGRLLQADFADDHCDAGAPASVESPVAAMLGSPCLTPPASVPRIEAGQVAGGAWSFRIEPAQRDLATGFVRYLQQEHAAKIAVIGEDTPLSRATAELFTAAASGAGMAIIVTEFIPRGATDFAPLLARLMAMAPDHVVISAMDASNRGFFSQFELFDWQVPVTGLFDIAAARDAVTPEFLAAGGLAGLAAVEVFSPALPTQPVLAFVGEFIQRFGAPPTYDSFHAYQAIYLLADAMGRAASDRAADLLAALRQSHMPALSGGSLAFDDHHQAHPDGVVSGLRHGRIVVIGQFRT